MPAHLSLAATSRPSTVPEYLRPGPWSPRATATGLVGIVRDGLLVREVAVGPTASAELLGPGDVILLPPADEHLLDPSATCWTVLHGGSVAWLNAPLEAVGREAPRLAANLLCRAQRRIDHLAFCQSVTQLKRIDDRVLAMLWHLAERWGRGPSSGVVVELSLTHRALGRLIGAQRPWVTPAIGVLARRGELERTSAGGWRLLGPP